MRRQEKIQDVSITDKTFDVLVRLDKKFRLVVLGKDFRLENSLENFVFWILKKQLVLTGEYSGYSRNPNKLGLVDRD